MAIDGIAARRLPVWEHGPAFTALSERERRFVLAMIADPFGNATEWVKAAGYACHDGAKVTGHRVLHRARVERAVFEVARSLLTAEGPLLAIAGLIEIARDRGHRQRLRALETLANRTGLHELSEHRVMVERVEESIEAKAERIRMLAQLLGVDVGQLLGHNLTDRPPVEVKQIEGSKVEDVVPGLQNRAKSAT
jgi:hypothetical protein